MVDWCREQFSDMYGECDWDDCDLGWEKWHDNIGLQGQLDNELYDEILFDKGSELHYWWRTLIIETHYDIIKTEYFPTQPGDHCHQGTWRSNFVIKTGYDYGYQDYCFKNGEDAFYFKIMWDEEVFKRN